jgi:uncharacterized protein (DUF433 family)
VLQTARGQRGNKDLARLDEPLASCPDIAFKEGCTEDKNSELAPNPVIVHQRVAVHAIGGLEFRRRQQLRDTATANTTGAEPMSELARIIARPDQCGGRPCIRELRVRVKDILDLVAAGTTREEILEDYPYLEAADITAALEFAALETDHPVLGVA